MIYYRHTSVVVKILESQNLHASVVGDGTTPHDKKNASDSPKPEILEEIRSLYLAHRIQRMLFSENES